MIIVALIKRSWRVSISRLYRAAELTLIVATDYDGRLFVLSEPQRAAEAGHFIDTHLL
jgi:hypothetical protein